MNASNRSQTFRRKSIAFNAPNLSGRTSLGMLNGGMLDEHRPYKLSRRGGIFPSGRRNGIQWK